MRRERIQKIPPRPVGTVGAVFFSQVFQTDKSALFVCDWKHNHRCPSALPGALPTRGSPARQDPVFGSGHRVRQLKEKAKASVMFSWLTSLFNACVSVRRTLVSISRPLIGSDISTGLII